MATPNPSTAEFAQAYARDGYVFPLDIISPAEAQALRTELEDTETQFEGDPEMLGLVRSYPDRLLPAFDRLVRAPQLVAAANAVLGPDLLVWSAQFFIKEPNSPKIVSWHQDLTYWGLDNADETTGWVALSPATKASGCMRFVAGTHTQKIVPHVDTFSDNNLLTRGQEIAVDVDEASAVDIELAPGQASLHHGHLFHASGPNTTADRRIGLAIRYIKTSMKQRTGDRSLVTLVSGEDRHGNFTVAGAPKGRLHPDDIAMCREDSAIKRRVLYEGADPQKGGKRY
ncbi:MAG: phytanoyl-CoA dioxygenase family protein [Hyphomicrobiaceae bacterium]